MEAKQGRML